MFEMKKRILALLLAGLMAVSLASCIKDKDNAGGTEGAQQLPVGDPTDPAAVWQDMDDYVYVTVEKVILRVNMDTEEGGVEVSGATKLHRISGSNSWSRVEYNGANYFVDNKSLTTDDLLGDSFDACEPTVMYASSGVNIRKYASSTAAISQETLGFLNSGDSVTVVAKGTNWYKVKLTDSDSTVSYGFVFARYLASSSSGVVLQDYTEHFTKIDARVMYVAKGNYNLRTAPSLESDIKAVLNGDDGNTTLTVIGMGKGDYSSWSMIKFPDEVEVGYPQTYSTCYIKNSALISIPNQTLDDIISANAGFTKLDAEQNMYVVENISLNARTSADFEATDNIAFSLASKEKVVVVAKGMVANTPCYVIEYREGMYLFVSGKYLTTDSTGKPSSPLTLDDMLAMYEDFSKCEESTFYVSQKAICFNTPNENGIKAKELKGGESVTMLAKDKDGIWCYVKASDGKCYFAGISCFTQDAPVG